MLESDLVLFILLRIHLISMVGCSNIVNNGKIICMDFIALLDPGRAPVKYVDVIKGDSVNILCRFCEDYNSFHTITWQYKKRGGKEFIHLNESSGTLNTMYNISLNGSVALQINRFNNEHSGIYVCKYVDNIYYGGIFIYVLEDVYNMSISSISGSLKKWIEYKTRYLDSINSKLKKSLQMPFSSLRKLPVSFKIVTLWDKWGDCEPTKRFMGVRRKIAKCWIHPYLHKKALFISDSCSDLTVYFCKDQYNLPCRSVTLNKKLPQLSAVTRVIPYYELIQNCKVSKDNYTKRSINNDFIVKYIAENGHTTLNCPEYTVDSQVEWSKDGCSLNASFRNNLGTCEEEPHITIDSRNSLYILYASKKEEGIYICAIDGIRKQTYKIKVVSMSRLLNQEFMRYSIYLAFVLSLTLICYCSGIIVAWHRRNSFLDPFNPN